MSYFEDDATAGEWTRETNSKVQAYSYLPPFVAEDHDSGVIDSQRPFQAAEEAAALGFEFDIQAFVTVVCFMAFVALLCGWFDQWIAEHRESRPMTVQPSETDNRQADWEQTQQWASGIPLPAADLDSLQSALPEEERFLPNRHQQTSGGESAGSDPDHRSTSAKGKRAPGKSDGTAKRKKGAGREAHSSL